ncbi:hypothetical protein P3T37_000894 [Kitasatospora sp. MAA4]|uniref:hypothetical protein n=1 Tax=Kitasatospora sp. MAA4 TaxID=3035093 RepID=UPI002473927D|nr:hypothetical protein [Kitasatospora sp. MAA4]MDH6131525.1 hypothetical protein [Kitasatospora sp. MAA4]
MITADNPQAPSLTAAVADLEQAVAARDGARTEEAFGAVWHALQHAPADEGARVGPQLAALVPDFPATAPRAMLALMAGACVERGADPLACAEPILTGVREAVADALEFARRWQSTGEDDLPEADDAIIDEPLLSRLSGTRAEALRLALAWTSIDQWQPPALAVLCRSPQARRELTEQLAEWVDQLWSLERHDLKCLAYALEILDDEPLVVLHRPSGAGFELRIGGIGDNFQLHTLLAHVLIGGGHLPGEAPAAEAVGLALDQKFDPAADFGGLVAYGAFNLAAPDGEWIWNEGKPSDIPVVENRRLLVLDQQPYERSWNVGRFFPMLEGSISLTRVLSAEEAQAWFRHVRPGR